MMSQRWQWTVLSVCAVFLVAFSGCGGAANDTPDLAQVKGTVTLDGNPVTSGTVTFIPNNSKGTTGPMSSGEIGSNGEYTLTAPGGRSGAVVGHHRIQVSCPDVIGVNVSDPSGKVDAAGKAAAEGCKIPARYASTKTSGLITEVKDGENSVPLQLTSTPPK